MPHHLDSGDRVLLAMATPSRRLARNMAIHSNMINMVPRVVGEDMVTQVSRPTIQATVVRPREQHPASRAAIPRDMLQATPKPLHLRVTTQARVTGNHHLAAIRISPRGFSNPAVFPVLA
ncbi:hypothetical protein BOW51_04715 [Solemya velesiana gill symbiont]|uniref:Uncharacterized protein n=1 Tax=Solemya velesiana gill symbiont TaxID=1918948 RepID=A0A1T2KVT4_9GAMM|nr:hypothetical protein BOW51_04715 [Solemya velesiana gill symbiont]